jgi:hypothetical protein
VTRARARDVRASIETFDGWQATVEYDPGLS